MDEESLKASKRRKIEETVLQILKSSDLEIITEFGVRAAASEWLGIDLSVLTHRQLVRQLVDSFLLSNAAAILGTTSLHRNSDGNHNPENAEHHEKQRRPKQQQSGGRVGLEGNYNGKVICKLSDSRRVTVHELCGTNMVSIRDFYIKDGNMLPRKGVNSGLSLPPTQWSSLRNSFPSIEEAIVKLESRLRSGAVEKPNEAEPANSAADKSQAEASISNSTTIVHPPIKREQVENEAIITTSVSDSVAEKSHTQAGMSNSQEQIPAESKQTDTDTSTSVPAFPTDTVPAVDPERPIPAQIPQTEAEISTSVPTVHNNNSVNAIQPKRLIPIQPVRLDGRNYNSWRHQMEFFLNQLNIAYVLSEPCPSNISMNPEASFDEKVKFQKWIEDDYMCRHNILNSLTDNLFQFYSQKGNSAKELWEELKLAYNEDFGTKRSQIMKYINFQMVEGVSVLEQVQELNKIADSVMASGMSWIDENFHVSSIISKLPPSWKEFRVRLMHEDFCPLNMLMHRLQIEEESRKCYKKETNYKKGHALEPKVDNRVGMRKMENKRVCYNCGTEGHISKFCPDKKFEECKESSEKERGVLSPQTGIKIVDAANTQ